MPKGDSKGKSRGKRSQQTRKNGTFCLLLHSNCIHFLIKNVFLNSERNRIVGSCLMLSDRSLLYFIALMSMLTSGHSSCAQFVIHSSRLF